MLDRRRDLELLLRTLTRLAPDGGPVSIEEALEMVEDFAELKARVRLRLHARQFDQVAGRKASQIREGYTTRRLSVDVI